MPEKTLNILAYILAPILFTVGIFLAFIDPQDIGLEVNSDGFVAAMFSLVAVVLYFVALMYQKKEFQENQQKLKESIKNQEKQTQIIIDQNFAGLFFNLNKDFNQFKVDNNLINIFEKLKSSISKDVKRLYDDSFLEEDYQGNLDMRQFAQKVLDIFGQRVKERDDYGLVRHYFDFAFNILVVIYRNKPHISADNFSSTFFVQLTPDEYLFISLASIHGYPFPEYHRLAWNNQAMETLIEWIDDSSSGKRRRFDFWPKDELLKKFNDLMV